MKKFNIKTWQKKHLTEEMLNSESLLEVINKKIKELGSGSYRDLKPLKKIPNSDSWQVHLGKGKIDPKTLGLFGHAFKSVNYEATVNYSDDKRDQYVRINLSFNYKHPSGSNGITVTYAWNSFDNKWEEYS